MRGLNNGAAHGADGLAEWMTQREVAAKLGISAMAVAHVEYRAVRAIWRMQVSTRFRRKRRQHRRRNV